MKLSQLSKPIKEDNEKDPYNAGQCPVCGKFATHTVRSEGAPVACENDHFWFRRTKIIACNYSDRIENYK